MSVVEKSSSPVKARLRSASIMSRCSVDSSFGNANLHSTSLTSISPSTPVKSFAPRIRSTSILLSESTDTRSNSSEADTSGGKSFVDLGEAIAELKDAVQAPWATPKLDKDDEAQSLSPRKKLTDTVPKVSPVHQAYLDRIVYRPLVASAKHVASPTEAALQSSNIPGAQAPQGTPDALNIFVGAHGHETSLPPEQIACQDENSAAKTAHDKNELNDSAVSPGLLPAISLRAKLPVTKSASLVDARQQLGLSPRPSVQPHSTEGGGGRAPPGGFSSLVNTGALEGQRRIGRCKLYNCDKGVGFIIDDILDEVPYDVKLHWTDIFSDSEFKSLAKGEIVEYTLNITSNGYSASFVTGPGGRPVMGAEPSIVSASRQTSFQLFKANALPAKGYKSKWEGLPKPEGFLASPTLATASLNNSPRVGGHVASPKSVAAYASQMASNGLGLDFAFNAAVNPHAPVHVRRDSAFTASPASTASPVSLASWAGSPQSLLSSPPSPWAVSNPFAFPTFGSPSLAPPLTQEQHDAYMRLHGFPPAWGRQPFIPATPTGSQAMRQILSEREALLNQQLLLAQQQRALVDLYLRTSQVGENGGDSPAPPFSLRPRAQTFVPGEDIANKENNSVQAVMVPQEKKSGPPLVERRIVSDRSTASTSSSASTSKKVKFARSASAGGESLSGVASAERAMQALRDAAAPRRLSPKVMITKATPLKTMIDTRVA